MSGVAGGGEAFHAFHVSLTPQAQLSTISTGRTGCSSTCDPSCFASRACLQVVTTWVLLNLTDLIAGLAHLWELHLKLGRLCLLAVGVLPFPTVPSVPPHPKTISQLLGMVQNTKMECLDSHPHSSAAGKRAFPLQRVGWDVGDVFGTGFGTSGWSFWAWHEWRVSS